MHQYTERRLTRSNYVVKDINSDIHGEKLLNGITHIIGLLKEIELFSDWSKIKTERISRILEYCG